VSSLVRTVRALVDLGRFSEALLQRKQPPINTNVAKGVPDPFWRQW